MTTSTEWIKYEEERVRTLNQRAEVLCRLLKDYTDRVNVGLRNRWILRVCSAGLILLTSVVTATIFIFRIDFNIKSEDTVLKIARSLLPYAIGILLLTLAAYLIGRFSMSAELTLLKNQATEPSKRLEQVVSMASPLADNPQVDEALRLELDFRLADAESVLRRSILLDPLHPKNMVIYPAGETPREGAVPPPRAEVQ
jgi:hypothetical protein